MDVSKLNEAIVDLRRQRSSMEESIAVIDRTLAQMELAVRSLSSTHLQPLVNHSTIDGDIHHQALENSIPLPKVHFLKRTENTGKIAEYVLKSRGHRLHIRAIQDLMYESGWTGSGDRLKDYKNLHIILTSKPKIFKKVERGVFELIVSEQVSAVDGTLSPPAGS